MASHETQTPLVTCASVLLTMRDSRPSVVHASVGTAVDEVRKKKQYGLLQSQVKCSSRRNELDDQSSARHNGPSGLCHSPVACPTEGKCNLHPQFNPPVNSHGRTGCADHIAISLAKHDPHSYIVQVFF